MPAREDRRSGMLEARLAAAGVQDEAVLEAIGSIPREAFVPESLAGTVADDAPLPIDEERTIPPPLAVARMIERLELGRHGRARPDSVVLEVGTGSGYTTAVLAAIAGRVVSIESDADRASAARARLEAVGARNAEIVVGDGARGAPALAPYDGIVLARGGPEIPEPLAQQLAVGGRMVAPLDDAEGARGILCITREGPDTWHRSEPRASSPGAASS